jgi:HPt (histidine-containing phosphotransfer) domain-containing protein
LQPTTSQTCFVPQSAQISDAFSCSISDNLDTVKNAVALVVCPVTPAPQGEPRNRAPDLKFRAEAPAALSVSPDLQASAEGGGASGDGDTGSFTERLVRRLVPASLAASDDDTRRRARLVVLFSFVIFLCGPGYGAVYLLLGMHVSAIGAGVAAMVLFATPFIQRRTGSVALGANLVAFGCYAALALVTAPTGGLAAPAVAWLALVPVTALMLGGRRAGRAWSVVSVATVAVYFAVDLAGLTPASEAPARWLPLLRLVVNAGLVGLIALLAWLYEANKDRMLSEIRSANVTVARARDEAQGAHREARLVLDNVAEGLLVAGGDGKLRGQHSRAAETILGPLPPAVRVWDVFQRIDPGFALGMKLGWEAVFEGVMPTEVTLAQMPASCRPAGRSLRLAYVPVGGGTSFEQMLLVVSDETAQVNAREAERRQREQLEVFRWIARDGAYLRSFFTEAEDMVATLERERGPWEERLRLLHTLKGNAGMFGLTSFATHCHELEQQIADGAQTALSEPQRQGLAAAWQAAKALVQALLPRQTDDQIVVRRGDYDELLAAMSQRDPELHRRLLRWSWVPLETQLGRLAQQARALAARLLHRDLHVVVEHDGTRLPAGRWSSLWSAAVHLVRNAIDHGIESPEERQAAAKPATGLLLLRGQATGDSLVVEVHDDGRGVDWDRVREQAVGRGLPVDGTADLQRALFADGLSTCEVATELSGRGIGMGAVLSACRALGGTLEVSSQPGRGTCVRMVLPLAEQRDAA